MGTVTSLFARKVVRLVGDALDHDALLASVGIRREDPVDPDARVSDAAYYAMLEEIFAKDPRGPELSMRVGGAMRCDEYGALGLAMKSAPTVRGTYQRAERYARLLTDVTRYEVVEEEEGEFVHLHRDGERRRGLCMSNEASLAALLTIAREVSSDGVPKVSTIAARLGMSGRTLQRRLADLELSFQSLVDEARRELSERLLKHT
ncbi:MAG: AraC family transcriptional regulator ligand-binding domain-containing protein, partial [Myxococcota bacterium]